MAINAEDYIARLPKGRRARIQRRAEELVAEELTLRELRDARQRSQVEIAKKLGIKQAAVSKLEQRTDMYLSTIRRLVEAMGGSLEIIARFPDRPPVRISQFETLDDESTPQVTL